MALVTTPGSATADSYATLSQAAEYHDVQGNAAWGSSEGELENALRRATVWLDGTFKHRWPGDRANGRSQALDWPRQSAKDLENEDIDDATIPTEVVNACCEAALYELCYPGRLTQAFAPNKMLRREEIAGSIKLEYQEVNLKGNVDHRDNLLRLPKVEMLLGQIIHADNPMGAALFAR